MWTCAKDGKVMIISKRKVIYEKLSPLYNDNFGKLLNCKGGRECFIWMRDRSIEQPYFLIKTKGNFIRGYKIQYLQHNKPINVSLAVYIPSLRGSLMQPILTNKKLLVKSDLNDWEEFSKKFRELTPSLSWIE